MKTDTVKKASVVLCIVYDNIVTPYKCVDGRYNTLITEVEFESSLFLLELSQTAFELFVKVSLAGHHTATHRVGKTPACSCLGVDFADLGVVGQTEIVVETPAKDILSVELHVRAQFTLESWKCEITFSFFTILADRATCRFSYSVKNVKLHSYMFYLFYFFS